MIYPNIYGRPLTFKKGAKKTILDDGATRWNRKNGEFLIERGGKIVTYGVN